MGGANFVVAEFDTGFVFKPQIRPKEKMEKPDNLPQTDAEHDLEVKKMVMAVVPLLLTGTVALVVFLAALPILYYFTNDLNKTFTAPNQANLNAVVTAANPTQKEDGFWQAPELSTAAADLRAQIEYGRDLIAHTAHYLGPKGSVLQISNGLNCQNCHLDAGTKVFGNNYGSVASLYPKFRARSNSEETIEKRVNDCFERSLNGKPLAGESKEMQAIKAYLLFLGSNVEKGKAAKGSGLKEIALLDRPADPIRGKEVYVAKCQSCHQANGEGLLNPDGVEYAFPPLWGKNSYNDAAGLYRLSNFAKYVKYNMPLGVSHQNPILTDEEAWDVAAFVNSQPHPHKDTPNDFPNLALKPFDAPFAPYADSFSEAQHKYGPYQEIIKAQKAWQQKRQ